MAHLRNFVVKSVNDGNSLKTILKEVKDRKNTTKKDLVKAVLWWALWWLVIIIAIILWIVCCGFIAAFCSLIAGLVMLTTSLVWMPFRLWKAPEKEAKFLLNTEFKDLTAPEETPFVVGANFWYGGVKVLNWAWKPIYDRLPMSHRQWFIDEDSKALKTYPQDVQVAYYDVQLVENKEVTLKEMSGKARRQIWNRGELKDREYYLNVFDMKLEDYKLLFENVDKGMFNLLKAYCADAEKPVDGKLQRYFVEQLVGERSDRAYEVLKVCALTDRRALDGKILKDLITMFGGEHGEQAHDILTTYWERCTLPSEVVEELVKTATESVVDDGKSRSYELVKKVVKRDGLSTDLAELFFSRCSGNEDDEMTEILNDRMDIMLIDWECVSERDEESVRKLTEYFSICEDVSVAGQKLLREWQYVLYRRTNHKLDAEAISYLLVKRLKESEKCFFTKVFQEAMEREALSETDEKLMALTAWKRDIIISYLAKEKEIATV